MGVFNFYGLIAVVTILLPNLMWAISKKGEFTEYYNNRLVSVLEQIGRFGCFITMIVNIPYTYFGYFFEYGNLVYLFFSGIVVCVYLIGWIAKGEKEGVGYALWLSIAPSVLFLVDGILILSIPLIVFAVIACLIFWLAYVLQIRKSRDSFNSFMSEIIENDKMRNR